LTLDIPFWGVQAVGIAGTPAFMAPELLSQVMPFVSEKNEKLQLIYGHAKQT